MHHHPFNLPALRQLVLKLRVDVERIQSHINQTPETHLGEVPQDPAWVPPPEDSST